MLVLVLTLTGALVATSLAGTRVPGQAQAVHADPPPGVGDCVLSDPQTPPTSSGTDGVTDAHYGICAGTRFGEIVSIYQNGRRVPRAANGRPLASTCSAAARSFAGADQIQPANDRGDFRTISFGVWTPAGTGSVALIGPGPDQLAAGQHWLACAITPPLAAGYGGTIRDAFDGGRLPVQFAVCSTGTPAALVPCSTPHTTEVFANASTDAVARANVDSATDCAAVIGHLTEMPDITANARLVVTVTSDLGDLSASGRVSCALEARNGKVLTASLTQLGNRPVPLQ